MKSISELFEDVLRQTTDDVYCTLPCQVVAVGEEQKYVDVKVFINEEEIDQILYNVPIQRPETQRAYIFLGIKEGDRGTLTFFDRSVEAYRQSDFEYNSDERQHDINDPIFSLGFLPDKEAYQYLTTAEIEIGLKNSKFTFSVDNNGNVNMNVSGTTTIICPTTDYTGKIIVHNGDVIADGISLKGHTHIGNLGSPTSAPQ